MSLSISSMRIDRTICLSSVRVDVLTNSYCLLSKLLSLTYELYCLLSSIPPPHFWESNIVCSLSCASMPLKKFCYVFPIHLSLKWHEQENQAISRKKKLTIYMTPNVSELQFPAFSSLATIVVAAWLWLLKFCNIQGKRPSQMVPFFSGSQKFSYWQPSLISLIHIWEHYLLDAAFSFSTYV